MKAGLKSTQDWFQHEIVRPHERLARREPAEDWVLPSRTLQPGERVSIYSGMYRLRMLEALEVDYPAVRAHLGPAAFERLAGAYLRAHPSRHYSLNFLGYRLPEYVAGPAKLKHKAFVADLARVEHAITEVFDAPEAPRLDPKVLAELAPEQWNQARIELVPALALLELGHEANQAVTALRHGKAAASTRRKPSWIVVYRKDWVVWRMQLERGAHAILLALQAGRSLPQAIELGAAAFDGTPDELQPKIQAWFAEWVGEGLFSAIRRTRRP